MVLCIRTFDCEMAGIFEHLGSLKWKELFINGGNAIYIEMNSLEISSELSIHECLS